MFQINKGFPQIHGVILGSISCCSPLQTFLGCLKTSPSQR